MIRSARIIQILLIMREVKDEICNHYEGVNKQIFNDIVNDKIKFVANQLGITDGSCNDKLSRQLNIKKADFRNELWNFFSQNCHVSHTKLGNLILSKRTTKDKYKSVEYALDSIKNY